MSLGTKIANFVGGSIFKEVKDLVQDYWPPEVSPEKRAEFEVRFAELEQQKQIKLAEIAASEFQTEADDKKNARLEHKESFMPAMLSCLLTVFIIAIVYLLFYVTMPDGSKEVLYMILGIILKEWGSSMQYWFGTTRSSADKNKLLADSTPFIK